MLEMDDNKDYPHSDLKMLYYNTPIIFPFNVQRQSVHLHQSEFHFLFSWWLHVCCEIENSSSDAAIRMALTMKKPIYWISVCEIYISQEGMFENVALNLRLFYSLSRQQDDKKSVIRERNAKTGMHSYRPTSEPIRVKIKSGVVPIRFYTLMKFLKLWINTYSWYPWNIELYIPSTGNFDQK